MLTIANLTKRWGLSRGRVEALIQAGKLRPIVFPAVGGYGERRKFTLEEVERFEAETKPVVEKRSAVSSDIEALCGKWGM